MDLAGQETGNPVLNFIKNGSLVLQIVIGLVAGIMLATIWPSAVSSISILGTLFINALKSIAPVLVFILIMAAISGHRKGTEIQIKPVLLLYVAGTFFSSLVAVVASLMFPSVLNLQIESAQLTPPGNVLEVLRNLALSIATNPVQALLEANYIGILAWSIAFGMVLRHANNSNSTKVFISDFSDAVTAVVRMIIRLAPLGIFGLVATVAACGASGVAGGSLLLIPMACSLFGISNDVAIQVVGVGFVIGVLQDSTETALNSSTDVLFTAAATLPKEQS